MLRINLLPIRQLKKRAKARNQIIGFVALLIFLCLILGIIGFLQSSAIKSIETSIATLKKDTKKLAPTLAKMKELEKSRDGLKNKVRIIRKLKKESAITVHILDEVARKVDSKRMWLRSLKQQGTSLSLTGIALDERTVAQFMDALQDSPHIVDVNLSNTSLVKEFNRNLKSFSLACSIASPQGETLEETTKK